MAGRFDKLIGVRKDEVGSEINDLRKLIQSVQDSIGTPVGMGGDLSVDASFTPIFTPTEEEKGGVYVTLRFNIPAETFNLKVVLIKRALAVDEAHYISDRIKTDLANSVEAEQRAALSVTDRLDKILKYATQYDIIRLVANGENGELVAANPEETDFAGYPGNILFTFTTPEQFGSPSGPNLADIFTDLDPTTPEFDAYALITQHAPTHPVTGANQSYRVGGVDWVQAVLERDMGGSVGIVEFPFKHLLTEADLDAVDGAGRGICKIKCPSLKPGAQYTHIANTVHTGTGKRTTTGSVAFRAAFQQTDLSQLTNTALVVSQAEPYDGARQVKVALELTQPPNVAGAATTVQSVALKNYTLKRKKSTDTNYDNVIDRGNRVQHDIYHRDLNTGTISIANGTGNMVGVGTDFTRLEVGWKIKEGAQTFTITDITSATAMTVTPNASPAITAQPFTLVYSIAIEESLKIKPSLTYNLRLILRGRGGDAATPLTIDLTFATGASGELLNDTVVLSIPPAPELHPRNRIIKAQCPRPGSAAYPFVGGATFNVFVKNEIAARVKAGAAVIGFVQDSPAGPTNSAVEFFNDLGPDLARSFLWSKKAIVALYPTGTTIEFYNRVTNGAGVSPSGTVAVLTIATWDADTLEEDQGAATAVQSLLLEWSNRKGWKTTWIKPATNVKSYKGAKVVYFDNAAANFMNPHSGALAANEAAATIFVPDTHQTTHLKFVQIASQFQAGVKVKVTPVNVVLGVDTDGTPTTSALVAPVKDDPMVEDIGPASAVLLLLLAYTNRKGWKTTWVKPTTNVKSYKGAFVVYFAGANFMNPHTGQVASPNTEAGAQVFAYAHHTTHLKLSQIAAPFIAGVQVKVTPVNVVAGVDTLGTPTTHALVAPGDPDGLAGDTEVPGGTGAVLTAPVCSFEDGKLTIDFDVNGLAFMTTHLYNMIRLATLSETVPTFTITGAPNSASPTTITTSAAHGYSVGQTIVISGVTGNTAVNGTWVILTVPSPTTFRIPVAGSGAYTGGGTASLPGAFLNIPTKTLVASATTSKKQIHKAGHTIVSIKRRKLRDIFGPTAHIAVRYFIVNSVGESPSALADVNLGTITDLMSETGLEAGASIPAKTLAINTINVCPGGAFQSSRNAYDGLGDTTFVGQEWRDKPNRTAGGGVRIDTVGTRGLRWVPALHLIEAATNVFTLGGELCCFIPIRPFLPGDAWALGVLMKVASGTYILNAFTMSLFDESNNADIPGTPTLISATDAKPIILTTTYTTVGTPFLVSGAYVPGTSPRRQWLRLKFGENPPQIISLDNVMTNRGSQILPWGPALEDAGIAADVNPSGDTGSGAAGAGGGGGSGSGGPGIPPGSGGEVLF